MTEQFDPPERTARAAARQAPASAQEVLAGRMLLQVSPRRVGYFAAHLYPNRSGLILSGKGSDPSAKAADLRQHNHLGVVLADPARYLNQIATAEQPFIPAPDQALPFGILEEAVLTQLARGADAAISPTGYIEAEDSGALIAAAEQITAYNHPRLVFAVPISNAWLREPSLGQLIAVLKDVPGIKAVMFGGQNDPIGSLKHGVANLRSLVEQVPGLALMRTDIAALGALAHGAEFAAFGMGSTQRHIIAPGQETDRSPRSGLSPSVLFPALKSFFLGESIARRFAVTPEEQVPTCACGICRGGALDRFTTQANQREAMAHNVAVMMGWAGQLSTAVSRKNAPAWWAEQCAEAVEQHGAVNRLVKGPNGFKVAAQLAQWAAGAED